MLRRLTLGLALLAAAASVAACSSSDSTTPSSGGVPGIGPNFPTNTIYVTNTTQRLIEIYLPSPGPSATPQYTLGGSNTTISGPQYLAFNDKKQLFLTDGTPNGTGSILAFQTYATANVLPLGSQPLAAWRSSAPSVTSRGALTISCAAVPAVKAIPAARASTSRSKMK
jgi:hypothetical protein